MKQIIQPCNIYLALWCLRYLTGIVFMQGSIWSWLTTLLLLILTVYYTFKAVKERVLPSCLSTFFLFGCILLVYGSLLLISGETLSTWASDWTFTGSKYVMEILFSIFPAFVFYYFCVRNQINERTIITWSWIFFVVVAANYFFRRSVLQTQLENYVVARDGFTNNSAYIVLAFIPMIPYLSRRNMTQFLAFGLCLFMIFIGMKRGAILISLICLLFVLLFYFRESSNTKKIGIFVTTIVLVYVGYRIFDYYYLNDAYFQTRLLNTTQGDVNGRDEIYIMIQNYLTQDSTVFNILLGKGAYGSLKAIGQFAHNDWLELFINQGMLGLIIYIIFYVRLFNPTFTFYSRFSC